MREYGEVFCVLECLGGMHDIWCCFVPESMDFADKMGNYRLDGIRRTNRICDFCGKNS